MNLLSLSSLLVSYSICLKTKITKIEFTVILFYFHSLNILSNVVLLISWTFLQVFFCINIFSLLWWYKESLTVLDYVDNVYISSDIQWPCTSFSSIVGFYVVLTAYTMFKVFKLKMKKNWSFGELYLDVMKKNCRPIDIINVV